MLSVVHTWNDEVEAFYNGQIINQKRIYSQRFDTADHCRIRQSNISFTRFISVSPQNLSNMPLELAKLVRCLLLVVKAYVGKIITLNIILALYCSLLMIRSSAISASVTLVGGIPSSLSNKVWGLLAKRFLSIIKHKMHHFCVSFPCERERRLNIEGFPSGYTPGNVLPRTTHPAELTPMLRQVICGICHLANGVTRHFFI